MQETFIEIASIGNKGVRSVMTAPETATPPDAAKALASAPPHIRKGLERIRHLILQAALAEEVGEIEETLKWGEPAFLPKKPRVGTTIRLGWSAAPEARLTLFVHCQTRLIDIYRSRFPQGFSYDGNRAVHIPLDSPLPEAEIQQMAALALTYHRDKLGKL